MIRKQKNIRRLLCLESLEDRLCPSSPSLGTPLTQPDAASQARVAQAYGQLPLSFEANQGQVDGQVNFLSRGSGYTLFLKPSEVVLALGQVSAASGQCSAGEETVLRMQLVGGNSAAQAIGLNQQAGKSNYLIGSDTSQWHTNIANYGKVQFQNVYAGVDLIYYGNQRQLEYDFVLAPGADPQAIRLAFQGAAGMALDAHGNLVLHTAGDDVIEHAPVLYQETNGVRQAVSGHYVLEGNDQIGFAVGAHNASLQLVIDPVLSYCTYLGGNGNDEGHGIAVDGSGNAYVTGYTVSTHFPTKNPWQSAYSGLRDVFVTKLNSTGSGLVYSTYLGGSGDDTGYGIAIDSAGNAYVIGTTDSANFPTAYAYQTALGGTNDAFVAKLNASGSALIYSTYFGGSSFDEARGIAVDGAGNAFVAGWTNSPADFPITMGAFQTAGSGIGDAFVARLNTTASGAASLVYSTYLGGSGSDRGFAVAVDGSLNAYVTGRTFSPDFPTTPGAFQTTFPGSADVFVAKVNSAGSALVYGTFLGGSSGGGYGTAIAVDSSGCAYVTGWVSITDFPTMNALQPIFGGGIDAFVSRLNPSGSALLYSTYLGGSAQENPGGNDNIGGIAVDGSGNAYVTGFTLSSNFPTKNPLPGQSAFHGMTDVFVAKINTSLAGAASLVFSTYLGGNDAEEGYGIAVDTSGNVYVTGESQSNDFPTTKGAFQRNKSGGVHSEEAFVTKIGGIPASAALSAPATNLAEGAVGTSPQVRNQSASLGGPPVDFVASNPTSASVSASARDAVAALFALPINETVHQANPFERALLAESRRAQSESASAREATREETVGSALVSRVGHRLKATSVRIVAMDAVFARGDSLPDVLGGDQVLAWIG